MFVVGFVFFPYLFGRRMMLFTLIGGELICLFLKEIY